MNGSRKCGINTMEFNSAVRKNDMGFEVKWMPLEDIVVSEVSQVQKNKGRHVFSHTLKMDPKDKHI
jgi:hypothetical protein